MAFDRTNFAIASTAQGSGAPKLFTYITSVDNKAATGASGYFNGVENMLSAGDFILCKSSDGAEVVNVAANTAGVITTTSVATA